jgi:single-strand DNA-binding protein
MSGETRVTVVGNLTADPELRFTASGAPVADFTVAATPRTFDRAAGDWKDGDPLFLRCSLWRQPAENAATSLTKGARVIVEGVLRQRSFETRDGEKRTVVELDVDEIGASLRYATVRINRTTADGNRRDGGDRSRGDHGAAEAERPKQATATTRPVAVAAVPADDDF